MEGLMINKVKEVKGLKKFTRANTVEQDVTKKKP